MYRPVLTVPPADLPFTVPEVKKHLVVEHSDDDSYIEGLIAAAVSHLDGRSGILGRCLLEQTWRQDFDAFARCLRLPFAPVSAIASVTYKDRNGVTQTVSPTSYTLLEDEIGPFVRFANAFSSPALQDDRPAVSVTFTAGYGAEAEDVPQPIRHAMLLLIGHWYQNREAVATATGATVLPFAVDALLETYRRPGV